MRTDTSAVDALLAEYGASHHHPVNKTIHRIAVPIIALDMLAMADAIPSWFLGGSGMLWATIAALLALVYYARLSLPLAAGMAVLTGLGLAIISTMDLVLGATFLPVLVAVFIAAWAAQFYGHQLEGKKPSFLRDLQFLLIGPLWLLADAYRRIEPLRRSVWPEAPLSSTEATR